ncbi:xanthine permease [Bacillus sp. B15-48]|nr:xanthine permease [Bacillus sp. B15-48]
MENRSLSTVQWFIFLLANSIALPIVIGSVFLLSEAEISTLMQRTFFLAGLSSFIQARWGHRLPIADGPAGSWVSIFVIFASMGVQQGNTMKETLQILEAGLMISGMLLFLLGVTKWVRHVLFLFSPIVTGTFLFILAIQLSDVFIRGMIQHNSLTGKIDGVSFFLSFLVFFVIILLSFKGKGWMKTYAILLGILIGWGFFIIFGKGGQPIESSMNIIAFPEVFAWGLPIFNSGIILTAILFTFLLLSNTFAAVSAMNESVPNENKQMEKRMNGGVWAGGISHFLAGTFSTIAVVPLPVTAGFVRLTKQYQLGPFLSACGFLIVFSLFPSIVSLLASLPLPVASAALLTTLIEMLRIAIRSLTTQPLLKRNKIIIGFSLSFGIAPLFLPKEIFSGLPYILQNIGQNGLLVGTFLAMVMDRLWKEKQSF